MQVCSSTKPAASCGDRGHIRTECMMGAGRREGRRKDMTGEEGSCRRHWGYIWTGQSQAIEKKEQKELAMSHATESEEGVYSRKTGSEKGQQQRRQEVLNTLINYNKNNQVLGGWLSGKLDLSSAPSPQQSGRKQFMPVTLAPTRKEQEGPRGLLTSHVA